MTLHCSGCGGDTEGIIHVSTGATGVPAAWRYTGWSFCSAECMIEVLSRASNGDALEETVRRHMADLRAEPQEVPDCPECHSPMVWRLARRGRNAGRHFWGCSRYPECMGTRSIPGETVAPPGADAHAEEPEAAVPDWSGRAPLAASPSSLVWDEARGEWIGD